MTDDRSPPLFIDYAHHRQEWEKRRAELKLRGEPAKLTVRATVEVLHDQVKEARVRHHRFRSDEAKPFGSDAAPNPLGYFVAAVGF